MDAHTHTQWLSEKDLERERDREMEESKGHCVSVNGGGQCISICVLYSV